MSDAKSKAKELSDGVFGLLMLGVLGWAAWNFWLFPEGHDMPDSKTSNAEEIIEHHAGLDLAGYARLKEADRHALIDAVSARDGIGPEALEAMHDCAGEYAFTKSPGLALVKVFGWCRDEFRRDDPRFRDHFDELAAGNLSAEASVICRGRVERQLIAPASADFPWGADATLRQRRQQYLVQSHVDAQNVYGAMIRLTYLCELQYDGEGDPLDPASWTFSSFELS